MSRADFSGFFWHAVWPVILVVLVIVAIGSISSTVPSNENLVAQVNGPNGQVKAFPEAEGFGADSLGGRGPNPSVQVPQVIAVTNLNDSGPGSLRAAVQASGPRFVIFKVGGVIHLQSALQITNPYIYIAGQTAPEPGITLARWGIYILTDDVTIRYIRQRTYIAAADESAATSMMDSVRIWGDDVILDHTSLSWAADEMIDVGDYGGAVAGDYTVQWSFISEGQATPDGFLTGGRSSLISGSSANGSLHHNLFAHSSERNPKVERGDTYDVRNNVIYNWRYSGTAHFGLSGPVDVNFIGNTYIPGIDSNQGSPPAGSFTIRVPKQGQTPGLPRLYLYDNRSQWRPSNSQDQWDIGVLLNDSQSSTASQLLTPINQTNPPVDVSLYSANEEFDVPSVITHGADEAIELVLEEAGANFPIRDEVDEELVEELNGDIERRHYGAHHGENQGLGRLPDGALESPFDLIRPTAATVNALYPPNLNPVLPIDTDGDQVPDNWEHRLGSSMVIADAVADADGDGYLNIEEYINGMITINPPPPPPPTEAVCGNDIIDVGEICDGTALNNQTCQTQGFGSGALTCAANCQSYTTSQCVAVVTCGNGILDPGEECDGTRLNNQTCQTRGYQSGTLRCSTGCHFLTSQCVAPPNCGNGVINTGEQCDGSNLNNQTCVSRGFRSGTLTCGNNCQFVTAQCVSATAARCGDGRIDPGEQCDGGNFGNKTCATQGFSRGSLRCNANCTINTSACTRTPIAPPRPPQPRPPSPPTCREKWVCSEWTRCGEAGRQTRNCFDDNRCGTTKNKPTILQTCTYQEPLIELENFAALRTLWAFTKLIFFNLGKLFLPWQL